MLDLVAEAHRLQSFLESLGWRFCFIGGLAVQVWGEPRMTRDIDLSLMTGFGEEAEFIDALLAAYPGRLQDARDFALRHRTLLLRSESGIGIDISLAALPFESVMIDRSVYVEMDTAVQLRICSPEDLIVMKLFAGRDIDQRDAHSVAIRSTSLDWDYIEECVRVLDELRGTATARGALNALRNRPLH